MPIISTDSAEARHLAERDWRLAHLISFIGDYEYRRAESAFRNIAHSIIEQMLSIKAAAKIEKRVAELCGGRITPEALSAQPLESIRACGISMRKARNLQGFARYATQHDPELLAHMSEEEIRAELLALPGIGKWTCDMFLLFYLEFPDILPIEDGALRQAFRWLYGADIANPEVREVVCSLWHPYSSTAVRYLYRALNQGLVKEIIPASRLWQADAIQDAMGDNEK